MVGFGQIVAGSTYLSGIPLELQFYYSYAYALIAVFSIVASNLCVSFVKRRVYAGGLTAGFVTIPTILIVVFFESSFVNRILVALPSIPVLPLNIAYLMALGAASLITLGLVASTIVKAGGVTPLLVSCVHEPLTLPLRKMKIPNANELPFYAVSSLPLGGWDP